MVGIDRILVPVDFSEASGRALRYALSLAVEFDLTIVVAHVVPFISALAYAYPIEQQTLDPSRAESIKERMRAMVPEDLRGSLNLRYVLSSGDVQDEILGIARVESVDMIAMGAHGRRRFERWLLGSTAESLLRRSEIPLLLAPRLDEAHAVDDLQPVRLEKIVYAADLMDGSQRSLGLSVELARQFEAELWIVHVMEDIRRRYSGILPLDADRATDELRAGLTRRLDEYVPEGLRADPRIRTELLEGTPYKEILQVAERERADLIVLNTQSKSVLERALVGSTAERVIRGARVPVLSVPPPKEA